jgi:two-component sensor histidine kinase
MAARPPLPAGAADSLSLAIVSSSHAPLLLLDGDLTIVAASQSFCQAFGLEPHAVAGSHLTDLGQGEWNMPKLTSLLNATLSWQADVPAYDLDLVREGQPTRQLVVNARKLTYADTGNARLLLTINDVTDSRRLEKAKDDRLQSKAVMLQELQHRVANSLQIIASVLMQSARKVQSDETRTHLAAAHNRVLSIGSMHQHLMPGGHGAVELRAYFTQLCQSLAASMIPDPKLVTLTVEADEAWLDAEEAVSLGLIVTELTINALKHAFPGGRAGAIVVEYHTGSGVGTLSVADNGVGMVVGMRGSKPGLGTSIVEALVRQLESELVVSDNAPGTCVTVVNRLAQLQAPVAA